MFTRKGCKQRLKQIKKHIAQNILLVFWECSLRSMLFLDWCHTESKGWKYSSCLFFLVKIALYSLICFKSTTCFKILCKSMIMQTAFKINFCELSYSLLSCSGCKWWQVNHFESNVQKIIGGCLYVKVQMELNLETELLCISVVWSKFLQLEQV